MAIVHIHIERTGGVSLQNLYEKKYPGPKMLWYSVRDDLFAPFNIKTANYTQDWQLKMYAYVARQWPPLRHFMVWVRTQRRKWQAVKNEDLADAEVIIGHFSAGQVLPYLSPKNHSYRTIIREPLARMWSHYKYWMLHKGDVGHRVVPTFDKNMTFETFALLPEMKNYQVQAVGDDLSLYECIGVTEQLHDFARKTGLIDEESSMPQVNHFTDAVPQLTESFIQEFKQFHVEDYKLYEHALLRSTGPDS